MTERRGQHAMSEDEFFKALVQAAYDGRVIIGVDRIFARRLFTDLRVSDIEEATGESPYLETWIALLFFFASPVAILVAVAAAAMGLGWWALAGIPVALYVWWWHKSMSVRGTLAWFPVLVLISAIMCHILGISSKWASVAAVAFSIALCCDRLLYITSTAFLRAFVLRNPRALRTFAQAEGVSITEDDLQKL